MSRGAAVGGTGAGTVAGLTGMVEDFRDDRVRVVSDRPVPRAQAAALADRVERAWESDARRQHWDNAAAIRSPLTVAVLSRDAFTHLTGDASGSVAGVTVSKDLFLVPDRVLGGVSAQDQDTLAHELAHVQDLRESRAAMRSIPTYIEEGKAYVLGDTYGKEPAHLRGVAQTLSSLTGAQARYLLDHFRDASAEQNPPGFVYAGEVTGALFVEFLKAHVRSDAVPRLADAVERAGGGADFGQAFASGFGMTLADAESRFVNFVHATEGNAAARLAGTIYAPYAPR